MGRVGNGRGGSSSSYDSDEIPLKMWIAVFLISLPSFLYGYIQSALNSCTVTGDGDSASACYHNTDDESTNCPPGTIYNDIHLSTLDTSLATSTMIVGAWIGCLLGSWPSEKYGRRMTLMVNNLFFLLGAVLTCIPNKYVLYAGRFVSGFGVGIECVVVPVLLSEIATPSTRGKVTTMHQVQLVVGIFVVGLVSYGFVQYVDHGWKYVQAGSAIPAILMWVGYKFIPESPRWLAQQNRYTDASYELSKIRGAYHNIQAEIDDLRQENVNVKLDHVSWTEVFSHKRAVIIGCGLMLASALSGINSVMFYSTTIFKSAGFNDALLGTVALGAVNVIATFISAYLVDSWGRKTLLVSGTQIMVFSLLLLSIVLLAANDAPTFQGYVSLIGVLVYVLGFAIGIGAVSWVIMSEILSTRVRTKAFGLFVSLNWGGNLILGMLTLSAIDMLGGVKSDMDDDEEGDARKKGVAYVYLIFFAICFLSTIFFVSHVPETKGLSPEDFEAESEHALLSTTDHEESNTKRVVRDWN